MVIPSEAWESRLIRVQPERLTYNKDEKPDTPGSSRSLSLPQDDNGLCTRLLFIITNLSAYVIPSEAWESRLIKVQPERLTYNKDEKPDTPGSLRSLSLPQDDNVVYGAHSPGQNL